MDKHELRDMYKNETGNPFPDDIVKYADWLEEKFTSTNTGSPKLPTLVECEQWYVKKKCGFEHITELEKNVIREIHDYICRQLRASA